MSFIKERKKIIIIAIGIIATIAILGLILFKCIDSIQAEKSYKQAEKYMEEGEYFKALTNYRKAANYKDGRKKYAELYNSEYNVVSAGELNTVGIKTDGTAVSTKVLEDDTSYKYPGDAGQANVGDWKDLVAISSAYVTVGLKSDGTVVVTGDIGFGQKEVGDWKDIVAISSGEFTTVGLKSDGTVVATRIKDIDEAPMDVGQTEVYDWKDIVAVSATQYNTIGLKSDGTVVATKVKDCVRDEQNGEIVYTNEKSDDDKGQTEVSGWKDIVAISASDDYTVGLKSDGTVVSTKYIYNNKYDKEIKVSNWTDNDLGKTKVKDWKDIVAISTSAFHTVGLKSDGTVVSTKITDSEYDYGQTDVSDWTDIVAISAGRYVTVGLKSDGTVVSTKITHPYEDYGQAKVEAFNSIKAPKYKLVK